VPGAQAGHVFFSDLQVFESSMSRNGLAVRMSSSKPLTRGRHLVRTTNRIRAAATLVWLGVALANHSRRADAAPAIRFDGERVSLHVESMPLGELLATLERRGRVRVDVHGDASSGVTVSDSFDDADVVQALRRVLSAQSHVLIDRGTSQGAQRVIELILFSAPRSAGSGTGQESDRPASSSVPVASSAAPAPAEVLVNAAPSATSGADRDVSAEGRAIRTRPR
jgi:hypothetical protein